MVVFPTSDKREWYRVVYLNSEHWHNLRSRKLKKVDYCECCGSHIRLDVHHLNYRNLIDVGLADLCVLCRGCHTKGHAILDKVFQKGQVVARKLLISFIRGSHSIIFDDKKRQLESPSIMSPAAPIKSKENLEFRKKIMAMDDMDVIRLRCPLVDSFYRNSPNTHKFEFLAKLAVIYWEYPISEKISKKLQNFSNYTGFCPYPLIPKQIPPPKTPKKKKS